MSRALKLLAIFAAFVVIFTLSRHSTGPSTTSTSSTSTSSTTSTSTTLKPAATTCAANDFNGDFNQGQGAAGTIFASILITKTTSGTCTVDGYPLLTLQDKTGAILKSRILDKSPVEFPTSQANEPAQLLTLRDGSTMSFSLGYSDVPVGTETCASATTLNVQFKTGGPVITVNPAYPVQPCNAGTIWVSPFY